MIWSIVTKPDNISLTINSLYDLAVRGTPSDEEKLFAHLSVRFRVFVGHRVWDTEDAEEIVQDTLLKISGLYRDMDIRSSFSAWAYQVLVNEMRNYIRKRKRRGTHVDPGIEDEAVYGSWQPDPNVESKLADCVHKLARRNQRYARILNLKYQGYSAAEICTRLNISENNFYVILSRARGLLKNCLEKGDLDG